MRDVFKVLPLLVLLVAGLGCGSIYHRHRDRYPADPAEHLELRLKEAQRAENAAADASEKYGNHRRQNRPAETLGIDLDRLETAGYELRRRVEAARDAAGKFQAPAESVAELERLERHSSEILQQVEQGRAGR